MNIQDTTLKMKIQNRVSELVKTNGDVSFSVISEKIVAEFGETAIEEAKKQYDFMNEW